MPAVIPATYSAPAQNTGPIGTPPSDRHYWGYFPELRQYGWRLRDIPQPMPAKIDRAPAPRRKVESTDEFLTGVVLGKVRPGNHYWTPYHGDITPGAAHGLLGDAGAGNGITDDSAKWHLAIVGDDAFCKRVREDLVKLGADSKVLLQCYRPDNWAVTQFKLIRGVTLRKPSPERVSETVGALSLETYTLELLLKLLSSEGGPLWKPAPPAPVDPSQPAPAPAPAPAPIDLGKLSLLDWALIGLAIYLLYRRNRAQPK